ncbi:MAG: gliding motility-associated C-terminal domain-containing protein [Bacteroidales bacterium]|nr:gliding motility-associated C-terminal domain-containing protein [Bacteroidales bacterium]
MKRIIFTRYFFIIFSLLFANAAFSQTDREFWFVAPEVSTAHYDNQKYNELGGKIYRGGEPVFLRFTSLEKPTVITITQPANPLFDTIRISLPANDNESLNLTDMGLQSMIENQYGTLGYNNKGLHIESTNLITAYYEVYTTNNCDLFSLKGKNSLGTEFYTPFQTTSRNVGMTPAAYSKIDIVATVDGTEIWVTPSKNVHDGRDALVPFLVKLDKGETFSVVPRNFAGTAADHLAGTHLNSNYPIAVTISDDSALYPGDGCYDLGGDQIIPLEVIGYEYIAMKGKLGTNNQGVVDKNARDQLYILATEDNTDIYINGVFYETMNKAQTSKYLFKDADYVVHVRTDSDKPVYVLQVSGFGCEQGQAILPPTSSCTGSTRVGFTRSNNYACFLNIMVRKDAYDGFTLNGKPILRKLTDWKVPLGDNVWLATIVDLDTLTATTIDALDYGLLVNDKDLFHMAIFNGNASGGCRYGYFSDFHKLKVEAITAETQTGFYRICYGEKVELEAQGGTDFYWTPQDFLDDPYSQFPSLTPRYTTKYMVHVSGACDMKDSAEVTIELLPKVESVFSLDTTQACAPYKVRFDNQSTGVTEEYKWTFGDGTSLIESNSPRYVYHEYNNKTDSIATYEVKLVTKNIESCRDTLKYTMRLFPEVKAQFIQSSVVGCQPMVVNFSNQSTGMQNPTPHRWEFGDGASSSNLSPSHSYSFPNIKNDSTFDVSLVVANSYYCYDTAYSTVTIHPYIDAQFSFAPVISCNPYDLQISNTSIGVDTYSWNFGDGSAISADPSKLITHNYNNVTGIKQVYNVDLIASNDELCTDTVKKTVTVYPQLTALFSASATVGCDSLMVNFTNSSIGATIYNWDFGDGASSNELSPSHLFRNLRDRDTIYIVSLVIGTENMFCTDTFTIGIRVHPYIKAGFNVVPVNGCTPHTVTITNTSVNVDTYNWDFGDGTTSGDDSQLFTHQYVNNNLVATNYNLTLVVSNDEGCTRMQTRKVKVYPNIAADFVTSQDESCYGDTIIFSNLSIGALRYEWNFGDNSTSSLKDTVHVFDYKGSIDTVYIVTLTAMSDSLSTCKNSKSIPITVHPYLKAIFAIDKQAACSPFEIKITNSSVGVSSRTWYFGDGTSSNLPGSNITHLYENNGSTTLQYPIKLIVNSALGCTDSSIRVVSVYPKVEAHFSTFSGCDPHYIANFNNSSNNATIFNWNFGDGVTSSEKNPTHSFRNFSTFKDTIIKVSLRAESAFGCFDVFDTTVTVFASPKAAFSLENASDCPPYNIPVKNESLGHDSTYWNFGNGTDTSMMTKNFNVIFNNNTSAIINYPITQIVYIKSSGCSDTLIRNFVAYPPVHANFEVNSGCHPLVITDFKNTSTGGSSWEWDMGDGTSRSAQFPTKTFRNFSSIKDTTFTITLTVTSFTGCKDVYDTTITVYNKPLADFDLGNVTGCSPYHLPISNKAIGADSLIWDFGDSGPISNTKLPIFEHDYFNATNKTIDYPITLTAITSDGCSDTIVHNAKIYPDIKAFFSIQSGCDSLFVSNFNNASVGLVNNYMWNFGDGTSSSKQNPTHYFRNYSRVKDTVYTVSLNVENINGCTHLYDTVIAIYHRPYSDFTLGNIPGCSPLPVQINNNSLGFDSLVWNFGDTTAISNFSGSIFSHTYSNLRSEIFNFPITLTSYTDKGCSDTITRNAPVYPQVIVNFDVVSGCDPHTINSFNNTTINAIVYNWNFGDSESSDLKDPAHGFRNYSRAIDSVYTVELYAESIYGCNDTLRKDVTVFHKPMAEFSILNSPICAPDTIFIINNSIGMDSCLWNFADGSYDTTFKEKNIQHIYTNMSSELNINSIELVTRTINGCTHTITRNATVYPLVSADYELKTNGCSPLKVDFKNNSIGGYSYLWNFGDGNSSGLHSPKNTYYNYSNLIDSAHAVSLIVTSKYGCKARLDTNVYVYPNPFAEFIVLNSPSCSPADINIKSESIGASVIVWDFDDQTEDIHASNRIFPHTFYNETSDYDVFSISQIVLNNRGCTDTVIHDAIVYPLVTSEFNVTLGGCNPLTINTENNSFGVKQTVWDFGDGNKSSQFQPEHKYHNYSHTETDTFKVSLSNENNYGCKAYSDTLVVIFPKPKSDFALTIDRGCSPFEVEISNLSEGAVENNWSFDDGKTSKTNEKFFTHTYTNDTTLTTQAYTITLVVTNDQACSDTIEKIINVFPEVTADFTGDFEGCSPHLAAFYDNSILANKYFWDFDDGETSNILNPYHYFTNETPNNLYFKVKLTAYSIYNCIDTVTKTVTVFPTPDADFKPDPVMQVFPSSANSVAPVKFTDNTKPGKNWNYFWDFGDGNKSTQQGDVSHDYLAWNENDEWYTVQLITVSDKNCADTAFSKIRINSPLPEVKFSIFPTQGCPPLTVYFNNESAYENSVQWEIKESDKLIQVFYTDNPSYVFTSTGTHDIILTVKGDGGVVSVDTTVVVFTKPIADFDFTPTEVYLPDGELFLQNMSKPYDLLANCEWTIYQPFKDTVIHECYPEYIKLGSNFLGENTVKLVVTTHEGCTDTLIADQKIKVQAPCEVKFPNAFTPIESSNATDGKVIFAHDNRSGLTYRANNTHNDLFFAQICEDGVVEYHLEVYNRWGEMIFATDDRNEGWNGYYRDKPAKLDVYTWRFTGTCDDGNKLEQVGEVTLLK